VVDYVNRWTERAELPAKKLLEWLELATSKFHQWQKRYGRPNNHNGRMPRDGWLADWEKQAIFDYHVKFPLEGYRRLAFMMLDDDIVAVSPSSVYRVLKQAGRLDRKWQKPSKKGSGFVQPLRAHEHWHVDVSYLNLGGTFYYLCSLLDGYSRFIVHWEIRESMTERDVETIVQRGLEKFPNERPRIISDNGPQFIAKDFKEFVRLTGITHVRTSGMPPISVPGVMRVGVGERVTGFLCLLPLLAACAAGAQAQPERKQHTRRRTGRGSGSRGCCAVARGCVLPGVVERTTSPRPGWRTPRNSKARPAAG
jgi:putative transposase